MRRTLRTAGLALLLTAALGGAAGCTGPRAPAAGEPDPLTGGPLPPAPAPRPGHASLFGSRAVRLDVYPLDGASPVRSPYVLVATVVDAKGNPLRGRRVEWALEGV